MTREEAEDLLQDENPEALFADGFDEAIVGIARRCSQPAIVVYDAEKCVEILAREMTREEAEEYFDFNTLGAWVGPNSPLYLYRK